ncbi:universal stress protein [Halanaeroarchaeum sulfurireducens]|uniref:Amino acid transporter n=1 Tax=Halanaeroarchaeum sulfurireducens TaxID=1604004 RepID=A0A0F7PAZ2_9EURY|nr:universal stress protein [Halanaeroarchaeum sulfurireducens]AKH97887.1 amino acid transporter [Halanaeroarchaeum sulfurireducens]ALG82281.1 amino acid transporter [Halanaeroarchaeum sulfurireducens]
MKELERDLGLSAVLAISIGAMIGSGIFILPALALGIAGPSVILAYFLAGLLVVPAALSKSEMATAMPEAGGTYIYIERGMGPLLGTVAGIGTWFSLSFKSALALVGGVPYLVLLFDLPVKPVALGLAAVLILVNILGAKQTGRLQVAIVVVMLAALGWFVAGSAASVQTPNYEPFFTGGAEGLLAATGLVFVSYAGVTKVASVAEEVEDPSRNIPLGILGSLAFTTVLYVAIVAIMVGVTEAGSIAGSLTPVAVAAEATLGTAGVLAVIAAAILALVSTANAGVLSSSRYPFAMSRDQLAPSTFATVSDRFGTPVTAITMTGVVVLILIAFVPILEIAKLASAFQILVFALVNMAVVAFRESEAEYAPAFESPLYPWMQIFGTVSGFLLLTQMGAVALVGAAVITVASVVWYLAYSRSKVVREGAATDLFRREVGRKVVDDTESFLTRETDDADGETILVALTSDASRERVRSLLTLGTDLVDPEKGTVTVVRFEEVPDQAPLDHAASVQSEGDVAFEERMSDLAADRDVHVEFGEIVSHDTKRAVVNLAEGLDVSAIVAEHERLRLRSRILGDPIDWVVRNAPCDVLLIENRGYDRPESIVLASDGGPYDPTTVAVADAIARSSSGTITLQFPMEDDQPDQRRQTIERYQDEIADVLSATVETDVRRADDGADRRPPDLIVQHGRTDRLGGGQQPHHYAGPETTEITVYPRASRSPSLPRRLVERLFF